MFSELGPSLRLTAATFVVCGLAYPVAMTGVAQALFPFQANGSIVDGGSALLGRRYEAPGYFHGRVSSIGYDAKASGSSNLGPTSRALAERLAADTARVKRENPGQGAPIPPDMLSQSGSGLDPHVSPETARWQARRVAKARGLSEDAVLRLIDRHVEGPALGLFGAPRVNVAALNRALDAL